MIATRKHLIWVVFASAVLTAPVGYLIGQGLVGSASGESASEPAARSAAVEEEAEHRALEAESTPIEDPAGVNIVPEGEAPEALVADCESHLIRGIQTPEQADQVYACEALLLAEEGKIAPGQYTDDEMESLVESQDPSVEPESQEPDAELQR